MRITGSVSCVIGLRTSRSTHARATRSSGPGIGFVDGIAQTYAGSKTSPQGATSPVGASVVAASDGRTTVAVVLIVWDPDAASHGTWQQHFVRGRAEIALKTFRWGPVP